MSSQPPTKAPPEPSVGPVPNCSDHEISIPLNATSALLPTMRTKEARLLSRARGGSLRKAGQFFSPGSAMSDKKQEIGCLDIRPWHNWALEFRWWRPPYQYSRAKLRYRPWPSMNGRIRLACLRPVPTQRHSTWNFGRVRKPVGSAIPTLRSARSMQVAVGTRRRWSDSCPRVRTMIAGARLGCRWPVSSALRDQISLGILRLAFALRSVVRSIFMCKGGFKICATPGRPTSCSCAIATIL